MAVEETINVKVNVDADDGLKSTRQMRQEMKDLMNQMDAAAARGDKVEFKRLQAAMGQLRNDMKDARIEMNALDPGELLSGFTKMAQGAVGSFAAITGAMQLFGGESEKLQAIEKKSMVLIQTMMGLETARQLLIDQGGKAQLKAMFATAAAQVKQIALGAKVTAMNALQTLGIIKQTAATEAATAAQIAFNKAAQASLYAAMAAAVLYLADLYYTGWKRAQEFNDAHLQGQKIIADYTDRMHELKTEMDSYISTLNIAIGAYNDLGQKTTAVTGEVIKAYTKVVNGGIYMQSSVHKSVAALGVDVVRIGANFNNFNKTAATEMVGKLIDIKNELSNTDKAGRDVSESNKELLEVIDNIISGLGEEAKAIDALTARRNKSTTATKTHTKALEKDTKALRDLNKEMDIFLANKLDEALQKPVNLFTFDPESIKLYYQLRAENEALSEKERIDALIDLEEIRYNEELALAGEYGPAREEVERKHQMNLLKIRNEGLDATKDAEEKFKKWSEMNDIERIDRLKEYATKFGGMINDITNMIMQFQKQALDEQLNDINKIYDQQKSQYDKLLEDQLISQEEYDTKTAILEQEKNRKEKALKHQAFEQERTASIVNATIAGIVGAVAALSTMPVWLGITMAAVVGGLATAQVGLIASQKNPYARGGLIPGKSHAEGGEIINAEGGEVILNKNAMKVPAYRAIANAMNTSTGGNPIPLTGFGGGSAAALGMESRVSKEDLAEIVAQVAAIPVIVSERDITKTQRRVNVIEKKTTI